jgi:hypothetical protein
MVSQNSKLENDEWGWFIDVESDIINETPQIINSDKTVSKDNNDNNNNNTYHMLKDKFKKYFNFTTISSGTFIFVIMIYVLY